MKKLLLLLILFLNPNLFSQSEKFRNHDGGGGFDFIQSTNCLSDDERKIILKENRFVFDSLVNNNLIPVEVLNNNSGVKFDFPLRAASNLNDFNFYGISGFVDHNPAFPNQLRDYNGGTRTYDVSSGYNHKGTDYFTWPFGWYKMDNSQVEVVAAESGVIVGKIDGNFDRNCAMGSSQWNAVYIRHSDNSVAWYGHFKRNSTTSKAVGQTVEKGEYLGIVGSSGSSTGPHLHLEIYNSSNQLVDPYFGAFNPTINTSWWNEQEPYYDSRVNAVLTHSSPPIFPSCPQQEILNIKNNFLRGDSIFFVTYYKDQLQGMQSQYTLYYPNGTVANQWNHSSPQPFYAASYWYWWNIIPQNYPFGEYKFVVSFNNKSYEHKFNIVQFTDLEFENNIPSEFILFQNYPNPFNPNTVISYQLSELSKVSLKIYDILGNEIAVLVNEEKEAGNYQVNFDASKLTSGVYYYTIRAIPSASSIHGFVKTKKMLIVK